MVLQFHHYSFLCLKIINNFKIHSLSLQIQKNKLIEKLDHLNENERITFVPNDLSFGNNEGIHLYRVEEGEWQITYGIP
ncbi:MAG: hypothetical protein JWM09_438 [Francisellaceae bacterium]|nr:hypothetical protein [Francisellaceae bacterium]